MQDLQRVDQEGSEMCSRLPLLREIFADVCLAVHCPALNSEQLSRFQHLDSVIQTENMLDLATIITALVLSALCNGCANARAPLGRSLLQLRPLCRFRR